MTMRDYLQGRKRRGDAASSSMLKILMLTIALFGLVAALAALYIKSQTVMVRTNADTLCPTDRPPSKVSVLLLDMSDEFSEPQRLKIANELDRLKAGMARFELIEAYAVDRLEQRVTKPIVHLCHPGTGDDLNRIYQNPELARRKWDAFARQLDTELKRLMANPASHMSPIFEAVQATALRTFNRPEYESVPKRLFIVSDLLQNVPGKHSQYQGIQPFREFKHSSYYSDIRSDLTGISVVVFYLVRPRAPQKWPDHYQFWEQYFLDQGAIVERVEPIYGDR